MHNCQLHKNRERLLVHYRVTFESLLFHSTPYPNEIEDLFVRSFARQTLGSFTPDPVRCVAVRDGTVRYGAARRRFHTGCIVICIALYCGDARLRDRSDPV